MKPAPPIVAPDAESLLRSLARAMDDEMLEEIAAADYGMDCEENLALLRGLRDRHDIPGLNGPPREVLELIRWDEPDEQGCPALRTGVRGHWIRAFSCAALLRADLTGGDANRWGGANETLAALLMSLDRIERRLELEAAAFIAAYLLHFEAQHFEERAFFGVALLWLALQSPHAADDAGLTALCTWIAATEQEAAAHRAAPHPEPAHWLLRTIYHSQRAHLWQQLGQRLSEMDLNGRDPDLRTWVALIGAALAWREG